MNDLTEKIIGSYNPDRPLTVPHSDVIAARNALSILLSALAEPNMPRDHLMWTARQMLRTAVLPGGSDDALPDDEAAVAWVEELRDRYRSYLPSPAEFLTSQDTNPRD